MKIFFNPENIETLTKKSVQKFMKEHNITIDILDHCSSKWNFYPAATSKYEDN
jgi:hypothetical protein